jgi:dihydrofolate reductase
MANLVYSTITSLDGYIADKNGGVEWGAPDREVLTFMNDLVRGFGTYLYGRRLYESMVYWETFNDSDDQPPGIQEFAEMWRAATKVVFSRTLTAVSSERTQIDRVFDPKLVQRMKQASTHDVSVGGANLAGEAMAAGLVDEIHLFITPIALGDGTPALPAHFQSNFELQSVDRFASGVVHIQYRIGA